MTGNVDEGDVAAADLRVREPEIDGDAAELLFLEPIRIDAGQRCARRCR
jgi:hypothetical protein